MHTFQELANLFEQRILESKLFSASPQSLYEPCSYFMSMGGKRVRPVLCLMGNELFDDINNDAWHAALGIELFHNFTLIHDDIMDNAPLRRGKQTVHERNGLTAGILCGDVVSIFAYEQIAKVRNHLSSVFHQFNKTAIEVCEGQQMDMDFEFRQDVHIDEYIQMITLKTSVLLACSLKIGAIIGGATEGNAEKLYEFGKYLGIAFQLQDDYLDAFGSAQKVGKQTGGDILANKKTYLLLKSLENANQNQREEIFRLLHTNEPNKVDKMLTLFKETKADKECLVAVKHYSERAFSSLDQVAVVSKRKTPLKDLAVYLLNRDM